MLNEIGNLSLILSSVNRFILIGLLALLLAPGKANAQFEVTRDSVVQLYGVIMTADSLVAYRP